MRYDALSRANVGALHTLCTGDRPEFASANERRARWLDDMLGKGLRGWVAFEDKAPSGYVEYMPIEAAPYPVAGRGANFLTCLWVPPQHQKRGIGGSLVAACLGDSPHGVVTIAYRGDYKPVGFFERFGFRVVDEDRGAVLLAHGQPEVELLRMRFRAHENSSRLAVDVLFNPECPWSVRTADRVIEAVEKHPARSDIDLWVGDAWACGAHLGLSGGVFLNGVSPFSGPPTDEEIARAIENALTVRAPLDA